MGRYGFSLIPEKVPEVRTGFRRIRTEIPAPDSVSVLEDLAKYESGSMHGQLPVVWDSADDFRVFDRSGNCWIDFTSTIFVTSTGHSNPEIIRALKSQLDSKLIHTYTFGSEIRAKFLKRLVEFTPPYLEKAFLLSAGTEATECAVKLMRMAGRRRNAAKNIIVSFKGSVHGRTMAAEMLRGDSEQSAWIGYMDPNIRHLPFPYPWTAKGTGGETLFRKDMQSLEGKGVDFGNVCGFMIEPYQGWAAVFFPDEYIKALVEFANEHDILVTFDEIQGGFGRTGRLFAYEHYGVEPDLVCLGKALSGSLPLSAVMGGAGIMDIPETGSMSSTHSANPMCCAAALANIEEIEYRGLVKESARKGDILHSGLNRIRERYPEYISHVPGRGLLSAVIVTNPKTGEPDASLAARICEEAMRKGLLLVYTGRESVKMGPPLTIPDEALLEGIDVVDECLEEIRSK